jgi:hypothetical protein
MRLSNWLPGQARLSQFQDRYQKILLDSAWRIRIDGAAGKNIVFSITNAGALRYKIDTMATRSAVLLGQVMRLTNFAGSGQPIDLYLIAPRQYASSDRRIVIRLANAPGAARREAAPPANAPDPAPKKKRVKNLKPARQ